MLPVWVGLSWSYWYNGGVEFDIFHTGSYNVAWPLQTGVHVETRRARAVQQLQFKGGGVAVAERRPPEH